MTKPHLNINKNELGDRTNHPEFVYPFTEFYLNWVIRELVLNRDTPIGLHYEGENWCEDPTLRLDYIHPDVRLLLNIEPNPLSAHHFFLSKKPLTESVSPNHDTEILSQIASQPLSTGR
jgi:hypothetical protein